MPPSHKRQESNFSMLSGTDDDLFLSFPGFDQVTGEVIGGDDDLVLLDDSVVAIDEEEDRDTLGHHLLLNNGGDIIDGGDDGGGGGSSGKKGKRPASTAAKKATHNAVERARRESLNTRFLVLADLLPGMTRIKRASKAAIVNKSIDFILQLESNQTKLEQENQRMKVELDEMMMRTKKQLFGMSQQDQQMLLLQQQQQQQRRQQQQQQQHHIPPQPATPSQSRPQTQSQSQSQSQSQTQSHSLSTSHHQHPTSLFTTTHNGIAGSGQIPQHQTAINSASSIKHEPLNMSIPMSFNSLFAFDMPSSTAENVRSESGSPATPSLNSPSIPGNGIGIGLLDNNKSSSNGLHVSSSGAFSSSTHSTGYLSMPNTATTARDSMTTIGSPVSFVSYSSSPEDDTSGLPCIMNTGHSTAAITTIPTIPTTSGSGNTNFATSPASSSNSVPTPAHNAYSPSSASQTNYGTTTKIVEASGVTGITTPTTTGDGSGTGSPPQQHPLHLQQHSQPQTTQKQIHHHHQQQQQHPAIAAFDSNSNPAYLAAKFAPRDLAQAQQELQNFIAYQQRVSLGGPSTSSVQSQFASYVAAVHGHGHRSHGEASGGRGMENGFLPFSPSTHAHSHSHSLSHPNLHHSLSHIPLAPGSPHCGSPSIGNVPAWQMMMAQQAALSSYGHGQF